MILSEVSCGRFSAVPDFVLNSSFPSLFVWDFALLGGR